MYIYTQTDHQPQLSNAIFICLSQNGKPRIVGYLKQQIIHMLPSKIHQMRYLRRQEVNLCWNVSSKGITY